MNKTLAILKNYLFSILLLSYLVPLCGTQYIDDFSQLNKTLVADVCYPESVNAIRDILVRAQQEGKKISIAGQRHSQGGHAFYPNSLVIDITHFNKILHLDLDEKVITVQTGVTWNQLQEYINPHNLAIKVMQTANVFTIGGSLSVNAHGRDPHHGPLIETIRGIRIMLASGEVVHASRTENYELFKLAIGGYGLFGIIIEADIELTENVVYKKKAHVIAVNQYEKYLKNTIISNNSIGLHYGCVCMAPYAAFEKILIVDWHTLGEKQKIPAHAYNLEKEKFASIIQKGIALKRSLPFIDTMSRLISWPVIVASEKFPQITCRNNVMRHPVEAFMHTAKSNTDVLQSYFVPLHHFADFMCYLKAHTHEGSLRIFYALTRFIPKSDESFLSYTKQDYIEVVLFVNQATDAAGIELAQNWTRNVVDTVLSYGGTYYLPVRLYPSQEQAEKTYPQLQSFFAQKLIYDPHKLFMNNFYAQYCR